MDIKSFNGRITTVGVYMCIIDGELAFEPEKCNYDDIDLVMDEYVNVICKRGETESDWKVISLGRPVPEGMNGTPLESYKLHDCDVLKLSSFDIIELKRVKFDLRIFGLINFGPIQFKNPTVNQLTLCNNGKTSQTLRSIRLANSNYQFTINYNKEIKDVMEIMVKDGNLPPGKKIDFGIHCKAKFLGEDKRFLIFTFDGFEYGIELEVNVVDLKRYHLIRPTSEFRETDHMFTDNMRSYIPAPSRPRKSLPGQFFRRKTNRILTQRTVNSNVMDCLVKNDNEKEIFTYIDEQLTYSNFERKLNTLVDMEDTACQLDLAQFNRDCQTFYPSNDGSLIMDAQGLGEFRPSCIEGDYFVIKKSTEQTNIDANSFQAIITFVGESKIHFICNEYLMQTYLGNEYNVSFLHNRLSSRRELTAIDYYYNIGENVLFPKLLTLKAPYCKAPSTFCNPLLNERQKEAIKAIIEARARPVPYILFGPPGTGKTNTLIEAVSQVLLLIPNSKVLVCAGTNCAVDVLVQRFHDTGRFTPSLIYRLKAQSRPLEKIMKDVRVYCEDKGTGYERKIIATTVSSCMFLIETMPSNYFTHIFIDEAGQLKESETIIPMMFLHSNSSQIVLAGDPKQLGPVVISDHAFRYGLGVSMLERLSNLPIYQRNAQLYSDSGNYNKFVITKLINNYRSHPSLIELPSRMFYNSELVPKAAASITNVFHGWGGLRNPEFPIIFHGVKGRENREGNSPSFFNEVEAVQVVTYLEEIYKYFPKFDPKEIGVMSPYNRQAEKIKMLIKDAKLPEIEVGSVEKFQGQERSVIILSTVRSDERNVESDLKYRIGFLRNPKRFNVAITRAKSLLIVIGNPHLLVFDDYWQDIIQYCINHKAYIGCNLPNSVEWNTVRMGEGIDDLSDIITRMNIK